MQRLWCVGGIGCGKSSPSKSRHQNGCGNKNDGHTFHVTHDGRVRCNRKDRFFDHVGLYTMFFVYATDKFRFCVFYSEIGARCCKHSKHISLAA